MNLSSPCIKTAADILGTKWTAQILREFSSSDQRFCELERAIPDINPRTLTKRLDELQSHGIITPLDGEGYNSRPKATICSQS